MKNCEEDDKSLYKFKDGFALQFVNPKVILYGITIMSTFILPNYTSYIILVFVAVSLALVALLSTSTWGLCGATFHKLLKKHGKVVNIVMALLLVYTAVSLFL